MPQGAVISPTLFNFYVADLPAVISKKTSFADDITLYASATDIEDAEAILTHNINIVKVKLSRSISRGSQRASMTEILCLRFRSCRCLSISKIEQD